MAEWIASFTSQWPFVWIYLFFVAGACARSQAMYWIGRGATEGAVRTRFSRLLDSRHMGMAKKAVERWGMPVIPLSFLTIGLQSAVQVTIGLLRVGWLRFTLWSIPGWLVWALIYATGGTVALWAIIELAMHSPWLLVALVFVGAGLTWYLIRRRRSGADQRAVSPEGDSESTECLPTTDTDLSGR